MKFDNDTLQQAFRETYFNEVALTDDAATGALAEKALRKAIKVIETNPTVSFNDGILRFVSEDSFKTRIVTKDGCSTTCDCKGLYSYHKGVYQIVERYFEIAPKEVSIAEMSNAPYFSGLGRTEKKVERIGNIRI